MASLRIEPLAVDDRGDLQSYLQLREYPKSVFAEPDFLKKLTLDAFDQTFEAIFQHQELEALLARDDDKVVGFALFQYHEVESITREKQTVFVDLSCRDQEVFNLLLSRASEMARAKGDPYLVYHTYETQFYERKWAKDFGMQPELLRTYMSVKKGDTVERHPDYILRKAQSHELLFIMKVVSQHSPAYIPANRPVDRKKIQEWFVQAYARLPVTDKKKVPLVLERRSTGDLMGYMILQPQRIFGDKGPVGMYTYDIAIGPNGAGLGLSRYLAEGSKELMEKMGGGFLYGDVSPENRLALSATLALGSKIDSRRWGFKL